MQTSNERFLSFLATERDGHRKRARFAGIMTILIALLLYQTQWIALRPGLVVLLAGQACVALASLWRSVTLTKELRRKAEAYEDWFEGEKRFLKSVAIYEAACQAAGFMALGYELYEATRNLWLGLAAGVLYPVTMYFGVTRKRNQSAIRRLRMAEGEMARSHSEG